MKDIHLELEEFLARVSSADDLINGDIEKLEHFIIKSNESMNKDSETGRILMSDSIFDFIHDLLETVKPNSPALDLWSEDEVTEEEFNTDINKYAIKEPLVSIKTIKQLIAPNMQEFLDVLYSNYSDRTFTLHASLKENGHGERVVLSYGDIILATSRGRRTAGKDITRHMKIILGEHLGAYEDIPLCELRGEVVLPFENLEEARRYNPDIVSAFTGVSSMIRQSASDEEIGLLKFVCYNVICDELKFKTKEGRYQFIENSGLETPMWATATEVSCSNIMDTLNDFVEYFTERIEDYPYFTDGIVVEINDTEVFERAGKNARGTAYLGNIALKVGYWEQNMYTGVIEDIIWSSKKKKLTPIAIVSDGIDYEDGIKRGVQTANGSRVKRVPLYNARSMYRLKAYETGSYLSFKYGGEAGVVPCFPNGTLLKENNDDLDTDIGYYEGYDEELDYFEV